ncbi:MAG: alpha/beta hydrolase [Betaproteobacteria bacterium]|nr:alpha/beta hydrolase [Betaproteobacteria bacterium]
MDLAIDGAKVFAYTAGRALDPAKPGVAFVHGAGLDHSWWGLQSRYFAYHGRNVLALDLPGHGRSGGAPLATIEALADWVMRALDAARLERASVVGHSMGSLVALECAARHPARVERIALVGSAFPMKVSDAFLEAARSNEQAAYDMETIWGHAPQVPLGANPNPGMWMYGDTLARLARLAPGVLHADLKACNDYAAGLVSAAKVRCPALLILGRRDAMTPPKAAEALARAIHGSRTVTIAASGHSLMAEAPDATLDALIEFLG